MADKKAIQSTPPSLVGDKLYLRPATNADIADTHHWYLMDDPQRHSFTQERIWTPGEASEAFRSSGSGDDCQTFVIVTIKQNNPVGIIGYSELNFLNRSANLSVLIDPDERKREHIVEATRLLSRYLFRFRDLNKVYSYVSELRQDTLRQLKEAGLREEGSLRQHHFFDGQFHDVKIVSLLRFESDR